MPDPFAIYLEQLRRERQNQTAIYVLWLAFLLRLGVAVVSGGLTHPETWEYDALAQSLLNTGTYTIDHLSIPYQAYAAPWSAWVSAASYWLVGGLWLAMLLQIGASVALVAVVLALARRLSPSASVWAGLLVSVHPGLILYASTKSHALTWDALACALAVLCAVRLWERPSYERALLLGGVIGLGLLSRGTILLLLPVIGLWWLWMTHQRGSFHTAPQGQGLALWLVACLMAGVIVAPWSIRTLHLVGWPHWMVTTDAEVLWRGNNPYASGSSYIAAGRTVLDTIDTTQIGTTEMAQAQWFANAAQAWMTAHPLAAFALWLRKLLFFVWAGPNTGLLYPGWYAWAYQAYYAGLLLLAGAGVMRMRRLPLSSLLGAVILTIACAQSVYYVEGRHRWMVEALVIVWAGAGAAELARQTEASFGRWG